MVLGSWVAEVADVAGVAGVSMGVSMGWDGTRPARVHAVTQ